jgi:YHS domain-containing protein
MKRIVKFGMTHLCAIVLLVSAINIANAADLKESKSSKVKPYTLDYCIVSGEKLGGSMGKPYTITYKGREIKFCCAGCEGVFKKDPAKYIKKIEEAEKAKLKSSSFGSSQKNND